MVTIIAEAGVNHNGDLDRALALVDAAADAGADVVKFQTFVPEEVISRHVPKCSYQEAATGADEGMLDMVRALQLDAKAHHRLIAHCDLRGIRFLSTPFDLPSLDLLISLKVSALKIPSGEITNAPLLLAAARSGLPLILSTGMCTLAEVEAALGVLAFGYQGGSAAPSPEAFADAWRQPGAGLVLRDRVTLLHCTTDYPAAFGSVNLKAMDTMSMAFGLPVGFSDHTPGIAIPIAAVARGATIIEKHLTLDCSLPGPDHKASLEPHELAAMVSGIRAVEAALGDGRKIPAPCELQYIGSVRKCLVARTAIASGETFSEANLAIKRGLGAIAPVNYWQMLGKTAHRSYAPDEAIDS